MRHRRMTRLVAVLGMLFAGAVGVGAATTAQDAETPATQFTVYPAGDFEHRYFQVEIAAGETMTLTAGVANTGGDPVTLRAFATNASNAPNGGFAAGFEDDVPAGATLWVDYPAETFEVAPGTSRERDFTVTVPAGTPPGQYVAALVVRTDGEIAIPGSEVFIQILQSSMSIEITVPGPVTPGFELGDPEIVTDGAGRSLEIPVTNTGNVLVLPEGELVLTTVEGGEVVTVPIVMGSVYPGNATMLRLPVSGQLPSGDYLVTVVLTEPATAATASLDEAPLTVPGA